MEETNETKTTATDEVRVQLAKDVLAQILEGKLCGTPKGAWFIGFEYDTAKRIYADLHLDITEENESAFMDYVDPNADDADEEDEAASKAIDARHGNMYLAVGARTVRHGNLLCHPVRELDLQEMLLRAEGKCCVCGIGSLVVAAAARFDNMKIEVLESKGVFAAMADYFSKEQLELIETVYEQCDHDCNVPTTQRARAYELWQNVPAGTERLRLIMENIVANNGRFVV